MLYSNVIQFPTVCQENNPSYGNISGTQKEFLKECDNYVKNIYNLSASPWRYESIVHWAKTKQKIRLGKKQEKVLRYFQQAYFNKRTPCFVKQSHIAKVLNIHRTQICKIIKSLEKKQLILCIQFLHNNECRRKRVVILPLIPELSTIINNQNLSKKSGFSKVHIKRAKLFCKHPNSKGISRPYILYTRILYINKIFNSNSVIINNLLLTKNNVSSKHNVFGEKTPEHISNPSVFVSNLFTSSDKNNINKSKEIKTNMVKKFLLKRKKYNESKKSNHQDIFDSLKKNNYEFDSLTIKQQNILNTFVSRFHNIDIKDHFKISNTGNSKNKYYNNLAILIRRRFIRIIAENDAIEWYYADKLMKHWNDSSVKFKKFQRINLKNKNTKVYKNAAIVLTYSLIYDAKRNINKMFKVIDRLPIAEEFNKYPFVYNNYSPIAIDRFFTSTDILINKYGNNIPNMFCTFTYFEDDNEFNKMIYSYKLPKKHVERINIGYKYFIDLYVNQFSSNNKEKGKSICKQFEFLIKRFLQKRIQEIVDVRDSNKKRNMCGYSLVESKHDRGVDHPPLLQLYFHTISRDWNNPNNFMLTNVCSDDLWNDFVFNYMQNDMGLSDFYKIINTKNN